MRGKFFRSLFIYFSRLITFQKRICKSLVRTSECTPSRAFHPPIQIHRRPLGLVANFVCVSAQDIQSSCRRILHTYTSWYTLYELYVQKALQTTHRQPQPAIIFVISDHYAITTVTTTAAARENRQRLIPSIIDGGNLLMTSKNVDIRAELPISYTLGICTT